MYSFLLGFFNPEKKRENTNWFFKKWNSFWLKWNEFHFNYNKHIIAKKIKSDPFSLESLNTCSWITLYDEKKTFSLRNWYVCHKDFCNTIMWNETLNQFINETIPLEWYNRISTWYYTIHILLIFFIANFILSTKQEVFIYSSNFNWCKSIPKNLYFAISISSFLFCFYGISSAKEPCQIF